MLDKEEKLPQLPSGGGGGLVAKARLILATPWTAACQVPLSMEFPRQEYWGGLPLPFQQYS